MFEWISTAARAIGDALGIARRAGVGRDAGLGIPEGMTFDRVPDGPRKGYWIARYRGFVGEGPTRADAAKAALRLAAAGDAL